MFQFCQNRTKQNRRTSWVDNHFEFWHTKAMMNQCFGRRTYTFCWRNCLHLSWWPSQREELWPQWLCTQQLLIPFILLCMFFMLIFVKLLPQLRQQIHCPQCPLSCKVLLLKTSCSFNGMSATSPFFPRTLIFYKNLISSSPTFFLDLKYKYSVSLMKVK